MKRTPIIVGVVGVTLAAFAQTGGAQSGAPQTPAQQAAAAARAKQEELEKVTPKFTIKEEVLPLVIPGHTIGEATGVAHNSKGHLFVFTRSGNVGPARGATASQLFEFDQTNKFIKQWGPDNYAASFAHTVRTDKYDNVWMTDEGSNMVVKFNPEGNVSMVLGRKPEAIDYLERYLQRGEKEPEDQRYPVGNMGTFNRPTDVAFDAQDNIFVSDGYGNSRVVKIAKDGTWVKAVGTRGSGPNQFSIPHGIATDAAGNVYVADRGNRRVHKFDGNLNPLKMIEGMGAPWSICVTPGPTQHFYTGDGNGKLYKFDLDGKLLGWAQSSEGHGQTGCLVHTLSCESDTVIYKGDCSTWTVEKITFGAAK